MFRKILDAVSIAPATGKAAVIGVDWGRTNDYTVFAVVSDAGELLEMDRFRGIEYALQRARLQAMYERHGKPTIIAEANSMGGPVIEQLQRDGLKVRPFMTTNASKTEAIEALALAFERRQIKIPNDPALIGELQAFEAKPLPSGLMRYDAPSRCLPAHGNYLNTIKQRIEAAQSQALPSSKLGIAGTYTLARWERLTRFLEYPELELSNNLAENSMRPVALGRKNWIHVGSSEAGPKVAAILSIVETCRRLQIPVRKYLADVLPGLGDISVQRMHYLTPSAWASNQ